MKTNSVKYNAVMNIILSISNLVFPLISFPYVTRILSVENIGKVNLYNNIGTYAVMLAGLGISTYGVRVCALRRDNKDELSKCVQELFAIKMISSLIVVAGLLIASLFIDTLSQEPALLLLQIIYIMFNIFSLDWFYSGIEQYSYITKRAVFIRLLSLLLLFAFVKDVDDFIAYAFLTIISTLISTVWNLLHSRKFVYLIRKQKYDLKRHIKPSLTLFGAILAVSVYTSLDTIMLGFICGNADVGYYTVAVKIKTILLTLINAISTVLLPRLSYYIQENQFEKYNMMLRRSISIIMALSLPLTIYFILEAEQSVLLLSGNQYLASASGMRILMPILLISGFSNIVGNQIFLPHSMDNAFLRAVICGAIVGFIMNLILMPSYGFVGAAVATLIAECVQATAQTISARQFLKTNIDYRSLLKIIASTAVAAVGVFIFKGILRINYIAELIISCCIFGVIYLLFLRITKLEVYVDIERQIFSSIRNKLKG